jgi:hypothetical protein
MQRAGNCPPQPGIVGSTRRVIPRMLLGTEDTWRYDRSIRGLEASSLGPR